jgi:hypothetical protein
MKTTLKALLGLVLWPIQVIACLAVFLVLAVPALMVTLWAGWREYRESFEKTS